MRPALALTRVQLWALLVAMGRGNRTRRRWSVGALVAVVAAVTVTLSAVYSFGFAAMLDQVGAVDLVLVVMPALAAVGVISGGTFGVSRSVLGGRDDDLLLGLPIRPRTIALAKMSAVAAQNALLMVLAVVPSGVVYGLHEPTHAWFWPGLLAGTLALALAATAVSVVLAFLVTLIAPSGRGRAVANVAILLVTSGVVFASIPFSQRLQGLLADDPAAFAHTVGRWAWGFGAVRDLAIDGSGQAAALLLALGLLPFSAVLWAVSAAYVPLITRRAENVPALGRHSRVPLSRMRPHSPFVALLVREVHRFLSSTVYLVNNGFGVVVLLAGAAWLVAAGVPEGIRALATSPGLPLPVLAAGAVCLPVAMTCTTAPSISLEGDRLWIVRSAPVDPLVVLGAKVALNLLVVVPALLPISVVLAVRTDIGVLGGVLVLLVAAMFTLVVAETGLLTNLVWPVLDAPSDAVVVKQSVSVLVALVGSVACYVILGVAGAGTASVAGAVPGLLAMLLAAAVLALAMFRILRSWGVRAFNRLG
ncbi:hypothetical protein GA0111570_104223 [Raineyella antarctica]|uniref:ABC-2 type transport system permease protein n=1 Tax=Raineyella antarctica TaxID=1577474 RepID=A0A1G6GPU1_9ACTN|nr:hypothetical protein [Raineyella antarctica]SDB83969.1 hypothetical protein GA0111570_104223 [Raineyella antarctica]